MKKQLIFGMCLWLWLMPSLTFAGVDNAVDNFFNSITAGVNNPTLAKNQSADIVSFGGGATRSQVINLQPMTFTPPNFNTSCGNVNFYAGALSFMTNTDQLVQFVQNTLMTAGITAVMTALKAVTPNIAGTLQSMFDMAQKMTGIFNNSCQLGMALGNASSSWMYDRIAKSKSQAYGEGGDAASAEINSTVSGSGGKNLTSLMNDVTTNYQNWVNKNANLNPSETTAGAQEMAEKYGSIIWKGMQALHLYRLPTDSTESSSVSDIANLVISLTGDLIIYSPTNDGTGTAARMIPPTILDIRQFMVKKNVPMSVYDCTYFSTADPGECNGNAVDLVKMTYPTKDIEQGIIKKIQIAIDNIQKHFVENSDADDLTKDDLFIIAISPIPIFSIAQTLDDIGMSGSISNVLNLYSEQIAFEILQKLINISFNLANQAASARMNKDTEQSIQVFTRSIADLQNQVNNYSSLYVIRTPVEIMQDLNFLKSYAQNIMSPQIMQKVNFAKQMGTY